MSFFCNFQSDKCPGPINGNPLHGLCDKVCVQAKKVFDACMQQSQINDIVLNITNVNGYVGFAGVKFVILSTISLI